MFTLIVQVKNPATNDVRQQAWSFDPANLDNTKMAALRNKIIAWTNELSAAPSPDLPPAL